MTFRGSSLLLSRIFFVRSNWVVVQFLEVASRKVGRERKHDSKKSCTSGSGRVSLTTPGLSLRVLVGSLEPGANDYLPNTMNIPLKFITGTNQHNELWLKQFLLILPSSILPDHSALLNLFETPEHAMEKKVGLSI